MNNTTNKRRPPARAASESAPADATSSPPAPGDRQNGIPTSDHAEAAVKAVSAAARATAPTAEPTENRAGKPRGRNAKAKLVHAAFTLPKDEYAVLGNLKKACQNNGLAVKKSQLLRVAVALLRDLNQAHLAPMIAALPPTKRARKRK